MGLMVAIIVADEILSSGKIVGASIKRDADKKAKQYAADYAHWRMEDFAQRGIDPMVGAKTDMEIEYRKYKDKHPGATRANFLNRIDKNLGEPYHGRPVDPREGDDWND